MKYRPTPLNIASGIVICFSIYYGINSGAEGWGILALIYFLPFGLLGLLLDYFLQKFSKKYLWTFITESSLLIFLFLCYSFEQRTKTLLIPDHLQNKHIVTIYGVDSAPKLPTGLFTWSYEIKVPESGILLTSTSINNDLPETKMKTYSGIELNTASTELGWVWLTNDKLECSGKSYYYNIWMVDSSCCLSSSTGEDEFKLNLQKQFCKQ